MIDLDTNVLVRYIIQNDAKQAALANKLIEGLTYASPGHISLFAIVELVWVLESPYDLTRRQVTAALRNLLSVNVFKIDRVAVIVPRPAPMSNALRMLPIV
jgi:predicted nucleic-acid-binding protein